MSKVTALFEVHRALGATFTDFAGWSMPVRYTSEIQEHRAVRAAAGLFDLCHMGEIQIDGPGAGAALDHALVGRVSAMGIGRAKYSMLCDHDGGILDDLVVYRLAEGRFFVVANASNASVVLGVVRERARGFSAVVRDTSPEYALIAIQGPASAAIVSSISDVEARDLRYYAIDSARLADRSVLLARTGYTGEDGYEVYCAPRDAVAIWSALQTAGSDHGIVPAGLACRDTLRLEAGMPLYGHELSRAVTPYDVGLGRVVDLEKPDGFAGDAALAQRQTVGPTRSLLGLVGTGRRSPRAGYPVLDVASGSRIGRVTSGAPSPTLGHPIAIMSVTAGASASGDTVLVEIRGTHVPHKVVDLPFYRRQR